MLFSALHLLSLKSYSNNPWSLRKKHEWNQWLTPNIEWPNQNLRSDPSFPRYPIFGHVFLQGYNNVISPHLQLFFCEAHLVGLCPGWFYGLKFRAKQLLFVRFLAAAFRRQPIVSGKLQLQSLRKVQNALFVWWLNQPIRKIWVKLDHFPRVRGENKQMWNHHL